MMSRMESKIDAERRFRVDKDAFCCQRAKRYKARAVVDLVETKERQTR